jgi:hypothetical protein
VSATAAHAAPLGRRPAWRVVAVAVLAVMRCRWVRDRWVRLLGVRQLLTGLAVVAATAIGVVAFA